MEDLLRTAKGSRDEAKEWLYSWCNRNAQELVLKEDPRDCFDYALRKYKPETVVNALVKCTRYSTTIKNFRSYFLAACKEREKKQG